MIEQVAKPDGYSGEYRFFKSGEQLWKAKLVLREARAALVDSPTTLAAGEYAVTLTVSPTDAKGKTMLEDGAPIVIDSHTHTFTNCEMSADGFAADTVILSIIEKLIHAGEARLVGTAAVRSIAATWGE